MPGWLLLEGGRWKGIAAAGGALVLLFTFIWGQSGHRSARAEARAREAAEAKAADVIVAHERNARKMGGVLNDLRADNKILSEELGRIQEIAPKTKVKTVTKWKTHPQDAVLRETAEDAAYRVSQLETALARTIRDRPDCSGLIRPADCPPPVEVTRTFGVQGVAAQLESRLGNTFAVGTVDVWSCPPGAEACPEIPEPAVSDQRLLSAPWAADLTEMVSVSPESQRRRLGWYAGVQRSIWDDDGPQCYSAGCPSYDRARWRVYGGPELDLGKSLTVRVGGFADADTLGLDVGVSWHGTR